MSYLSNNTGYRSSMKMPFRSVFLFLGILSLLFGIAIIEDPALLADIVALFFIVAGVSLLMTWWRLSR